MPLQQAPMGTRATRLEMSPMHAVPCALHAGDALVGARYAVWEAG